MIHAPHGQERTDLTVYSLLESEVIVAYLLTLAFAAHAPALRAASSKRRRLGSSVTVPHPVKLLLTRLQGSAVFM